MLQILPTAKPRKSVIDTVFFIHNEKGRNSMAEKYNWAIENIVLPSNEKFVCFRHDDSELRSGLDICEYKLDKLFESHKVGMAGVIGTIALDRNCTWWTGVNGAGGRSTYGVGAIIQGGMRPRLKDNKPVLDPTTNKPVMEPYEYWMRDFPGVHDYLATVDGCCMFFPKWIFEEGLRFDENLKGYHFYDTDISLQVLERGYKVSTIDITIMHKSVGEMPKEFNDLKKVFYEKWDKKVHGEWPISRLSKFYKD